MPSQSHAPLISVLVPTYKRPDMLYRCLTKLRQALDRESHRFELLVGDNSNMPDNRVIVEEFSRNWAGHVGYKGYAGDRNMQDNWNDLAKDARGTFLQYVHDDDYLLPHAGEHLMSVARLYSRHPRPVKFGVRIVTIDERSLRIEGAQQVRSIGNNDAVRMLLSRSSFVRFPSLFIPRTQLLDCGLFDREAKVQDWPTWLNLATKHGIVERPELTAAYTVHESAGTNQQFTSAYLNEIINLLERHGKPFPDRRELISRFLFRWILAGARRAWRAKDHAALRTRLKMIELPEMKPYQCPLCWLPILIFLRGAAARSSLSSRISP